MKKTLRFIAVAMVAVMLCLTLASCGKTISGKYEAEIDVLLASYTATYEFSGNKVEITKKSTTILGTVDTLTLNGTYEITEKDDGTMEITITLENDDDDIKSGTYVFEEGENYIKIGLVKYDKVEK